MDVPSIPDSREKKLVFLSTKPNEIRNSAEASNLLKMLMTDISTIDCHDTVLLQASINSVVSTLNDDFCSSTTVQDVIKNMIADLGGPDSRICEKWITLGICTGILLCDSDEEKKTCALCEISKHWFEILELVRKMYVEVGTWESEMTAISLVNLWIKVIKMLSKAATAERRIFDLFIAEANFGWLLEILRQSCDYQSPVLHNRTFLLLHRIVKLELCSAVVYDQILHKLLTETDKTVYVRETSIGFGGEMSCGPKGDRNVLRTFALVVLKCLEKCEIIPDRASLVASLHQILLQKMFLETETSFLDALFILFMDQDDGLIEMLLTTLNIHTTLKKSEYVDETSAMAKIEPLQFFLKFLDQVSFDSEVLLDFITSPETSFLLYFLRIIKYILKTLQNEIRAEEDDVNLMDKPTSEQPTTSATLVPYDSSGDEENEEPQSSVLESRRPQPDLESVVLVLRTLCMKLERLSGSGVLPFNAEPLLRNMRAVEAVWNGTAT